MTLDDAIVAGTSLTTAIDALIVAAKQPKLDQAKVDALVTTLLGINAKIKAALVG